MGELFDEGGKRKGSWGRDKEVRIRDKSVGINGWTNFVATSMYLDVINSSIGINFRPLGKYILRSFTIQVFLPEFSIEVRSS